jgi:hypothetical protein
VLLGAFVVSQMRLRAPLIPLGFFANRTRVTANLATVFGVAAFIGMFFTLTLYMQDVLHYSALRTGLAYLPFGIALLAGIVTSIQLLPRIGVRTGSHGRRGGRRDRTKDFRDSIAGPRRDDPPHIATRNAVVDRVEQSSQA